MDNNQKKQPMTWEDMEKEYGIVIERPKEDNRTILHDMGTLKTEQAPRPTPVNVPEPVPTTVEEPSAPTKADRPSRPVRYDEEPVKNQETYSSSRPDSSNLPEPQKAPDYGYTKRADEEGMAAFKTDTKKQAAEMKVPRRMNTLLLGKSNARRGIIWSELMMPPLAKRRK